MSPLLEPLLAQVLVEGLAHKNRQKSETALLLVLAAFMLIVAGTVLLVYALYAGFLSRFPAPQAALFAGVILLLLAGLCALVAAILKRRRHEEEVHQIPLVAESLRQTIGEISREVEEPVRENPGTALLVAALAGFLSGRHLH